MEGEGEKLTGDNVRTLLRCEQGNTLGSSSPLCHPLHADTLPLAGLYSQHERVTEEHERHSVCFARHLLLARGSLHALF